MRFFILVLALTSIAACSDNGGTAPTPIVATKTVTPDPPAVTPAPAPTPSPVVTPTSGTVRLIVSDLHGSRLHYAQGTEVTVDGIFLGYTDQDGQTDLTVTYGQSYALILYNGFYQPWHGTLTVTADQHQVGIRLTPICPGPAC